MGKICNCQNQQLNVIILLGGGGASGYKKTKKNKSILNIIERFTQRPREGNIVFKSVDKKFLQLRFSFFVFFSVSVAAATGRI